MTKCLFRRILKLNAYTEIKKHNHKPLKTIYKIKLKNGCNSIVLWYSSLHKKTFWSYSQFRKDSKFLILKFLCYNS